MIDNEKRIQESAQRLTDKENQTLHVPDNPMRQRGSRWVWLATPAAAAIGLVIGMSLHFFVKNEPEVRYVQHIDTIRMDRTVHDTVFLTQVVEKEKIIDKISERAAETGGTAVAEEEDTSLCTSVSCDGINYAALIVN